MAEHRLAQRPQLEKVVAVCGRRPLRAGTANRGTPYKLQRIVLSDKLLRSNWLCFADSVRRPAFLGIGSVPQNRPFVGAEGRLGEPRRLP